MMICSSLLLGCIQYITHISGWIEHISSTEIVRPQKGMISPLFTNIPVRENSEVVMIYPDQSTLGWLIITTLNGETGHMASVFWLPCRVSWHWLDGEFMMLTQFVHIVNCCGCIISAAFLLKFPNWNKWWERPGWYVCNLNIYIYTYVMLSSSPSFKPTNAASKAIPNNHLNRPQSLDLQETMATIKYGTFPKFYPLTNPMTQICWFFTQ